MKVLMVHNRYQQHGGEDESVRAEVALLGSRGHEVIEYIEDNERIRDLSMSTVALGTVWSGESYRRMRRLVRERRPDVVHVQNFFPLISPSVHHAARAEGVPVVQTLRNYRLLCSNGLFFRDGRVCEDCVGKTPPWPGVLHACYRDSRLATAPVVGMLTAHRVLKTWATKVDMFVALTEFARNKVVESGIPKQRIMVKPNFVYPDPGSGEGGGGYALFVGRLSPEKGVETMLRAWELLDGKIPLKIVGDGPLAGRVSRAAGNLPGIEWLGRRPVGEVYELMGEAEMLVFPSEWYETFGRVAAEAFAKGTPVVAAEIGAIAELVEHKCTGLLFRPGDPEDLVARVEWISAAREEREKMRQNARAEFEKNYTAEENYRRLMGVYKTAIRDVRVRA